ncbi:hypothetical protein GJAV_G00082500 [Gymnothorax javanicus]|nr:hypothetical protein GJAV_G00082500 [Gymnothorax javanicus]
MDSTTNARKAHGASVRATRRAAKEAEQVIEQKGRSTKRKRRRENEASITATNGSKDEMEDQNTDEEETSPNKKRKVTGEGEQPSDGEEDMEVKENDDDEDEDGDGDQDMTTDEDEEDLGARIHERQAKTSSGEPLPMGKYTSHTMSAYKDFDTANYLRSRRPIHSEGQGKEVYSPRTAESLAGAGLRSWENQREALPRQSRIEYSDEVVTKSEPASRNRHHVTHLTGVTPSRGDGIRVHHPNNIPVHKPPAKVGKQEVIVKTNAKMMRHSLYQGWFWKLLLLMLILAVAILPVLFLRKRAPEHASTVDNSFQAHFRDMKPSFPSQREELWKRSKIHLEKHLQTAEPTEPVSMILTAGRRAEETLRCLATRMAETFSSALGASVLHIDGASRTALESDQVKLDIDQQLGGAFEGDRKAAVIHRFEELPPGSTLIFYRYCDHENAAYKKVLLVFTVQLPAEELSAELALNTVEEMVQEHIEGKFLLQSSSASYDQMDRDKLSGLWSRISHLILPVTAEEPIEQQGCDHLRSLQQ